MSFKLLAITLLATTAPLVSALGAAKVLNSCPFPVYLAAVGSETSAVQTLPATGGTFAESPFTLDPKTGGRTLKITREVDGLFTGKPQLNFAYTLDGANVWYDLSNVFGDAFAGYKLVEKSADAGCGVIEWASGTSPGGSQVKTCGSGNDVTLELCAP